MGLVRDILQKSEAFLAARSVDSPRLSAELLLSEALACSRLDLYLNMDRPLTEPELARARELVARRAGGEPVAYILGRKEFFGRTFRVSPAVLIPRPETEHIVEEALRCCGRSGMRFADLGTGSGILAVTLALELPESSGLAVDISPAALEVARSNAQTLGAASRLEFLEADANTDFAATGAFDLAVANPPYVSDAEYRDLGREVACFEPELALRGGSDGLHAVRLQAGVMGRMLRPEGMALMEIGCSQAEAAAAAFSATGLFASADILKDLAGLPRIICARRSPVA